MSDDKPRSKKVARPAQPGRSVQAAQTMVTAADGSSSEGPLDEREVWLAERVDAALRASPDFQAKYPQAKLERLEANRGVEDHAHGRLYLRYAVAGGAPAEFWGHVAKAKKLDLKKGTVGVVEDEAQKRAQAPAGSARASKKK